ncbi:hypothetical protein IWW36_000760 [Coemansia brasiliensis]|uniref:J domain-containing protein n=1 Tax=Coemansia brasiliensis TaxID=2650707 RepID=A0A9W8IGN3_9FUNG|nr:hypothetical protein IWW36_000760 [Coemansia brasiliensis]
MRPAFLLFVLSLLITVAKAWEKLDHEIFELYDDIKRNELTSDWYELLGISPKSTLEEINRSYRQLSKKYHPDKLQRLSKAESAQETKRFQRYSLVVNILRDKESRKRYNFFRKNGVPVWRGTGYLYRRWRPGFVSVLVGLLLFVSFMQYLFHSLSYWRAQQRIRDLEMHEKSLGGRVKVKREQPGQRQMNRQMRRKQKSNGGQPPSPGSTDFEDSGVEGDDLDRFHINTVGVINPYAVQPASIRRIAIVSFPLYIVSSILGRLGLGAKDTKLSAESEGGSDEMVETHSEQVAQALNNLNADEGFGDTEAKSKKANKKAAKAQARRRRVPVV